MEREYTIGALLVLVTIFVIALIIYFTVPEFSQSVGQIADEVFGTLSKSIQMGAEQYKQGEAKSVFESVKKCIEQLKEKKEGACTCYLDYKEFPEEYYTTKSEDNKEIRLEKGRIKDPETTNINIEGLNFCILEKDFAYTPLVGNIYINSKGGKLQINDLEFLKDTPEFYSLKKGDDIYICFVTEGMEEKDVIKLRKMKDCKTGTVALEEKMKNKFRNFIQAYKECKEHNKTEKCKCGEINPDMPEPYGIQVLQKGKETTFFLEGTNEKEVIGNNKIAKMLSTPWIIPEPYVIADYEEKERIEGQKKLVYYETNQNIYLADPGIKNLREWPLCIENVNEYLRFDNTITEEEYKQKLIKFSKESKPTFETETYFKTLYSTAKTYNVDLFMAAAMITRESRWDPKAVSWVGAAGLMQLMPDTAKDLGLEVPKYSKSGKVYSCNVNAKQRCDMKNDERFDSTKNVNAGVKHIRGLISELDKDPKLDPTFENILASYNAGFDAVQKAKGVPNYRETKEYIQYICGFYEQLNTKVCYV